MSMSDFACPAHGGRHSAPLASGLLGRLGRMRARMAERRRVARDLRALLRLDDHHLRDIGLTRGEVVRRLRAL